MKRRKLRMFKSSLTEKQLDEAAFESVLFGRVMLGTVIDHEILNSAPISSHVALRCFLDVNEYKLDYSPMKAGWEVVKKK